MPQTKLSLGRQTNLDVAGGVITNSGAPVGSSDLTTKGYVDAVASGMDWKASVRAATTTAGTLTTSFAAGSVVDGVTLAAGDRILIKNQATATENGIYVVAATGAPTRSEDANSSADVTSGMATFVEEGTTNGDTGWLLTNNGTITLGTTPLTFTQFTGLGVVTTDTTLTKNGNEISRAAITGDVSIPAGSNSSTIGANKVTLGMLAQLPANTIIGNVTGATATPTAVAVSSGLDANTIVRRDNSSNIVANNVLERVATITSSAGNTTLLSGSAKTNVITGTATHTITLPDTTALTAGIEFIVVNRSTQAVTVNNNAGAAQVTLPANSRGIFLFNGTSWDSSYTLGTPGGVTSVSVVSANGLGGTVANASTTPAITLTTSVTGLVKGNGTALSAAVLGTDYLAPSTMVDREAPTGAINGSNTTFTLAYTPVAGSEHVYLNGLLQEPGAGNDYTISGATITYLTAPLTGDKIRVSYRRP